MKNKFQAKVEAKVEAKAKNSEQRTRKLEYRRIKH